MRSDLSPNSITRNPAQRVVNPWDEYMTRLDQVERATRAAERYPVHARNDLPSVRRFMAEQLAAQLSGRGA